MTFAIVGAAVLLIAAIMLYFFKRRGGIGATPVRVENIDTLAFKDVVAFFRRPNVLERLKEQAGLLAVVIRESKNETPTIITLCAFDSQKNEVIVPFVRYAARALDEELLQVFGDKDMIVLK